MNKTKEQVRNNGITLKGTPNDILSFLEKEQSRCGKITVLEYIRKKKAEQKEKGGCL